MKTNFIKPYYDANGFAGLPERIRHLCALREYDAVVLFLIDGFGWRFFEKFQGEPFLKRLARYGDVEKLTSQFPSTTAAHVTTIHTGLSVGESGVYEWFYYEPEVDRIIAPLLFSYGGDSSRNTLKGVVDASKLYPTTTLYEDLERLEISSHVFGLRDYTPSTYSNLITKGATLHSFSTLPEALINLGIVINETRKPVYINFYFDSIDTICHKYGPASQQTEAEIEAFLLVMDTFFSQIFTGKKKLLFMLTADHGASEVDPKTTIYLNMDKSFAGVERYFKTNRRQEPLVPAGSARDMFLYVIDDALDEAQTFLEKRLDGKADVIRTSGLVEQGYFGPKISSQLQARLGNLVILPYRYESVWWFEKNRYEQRFYGHHGGLTSQEMEIPFVTYELG